jgi:hypothetical protein
VNVILLNRDLPNFLMRKTDRFDGRIGNWKVMVFFKCVCVPGFDFRLKTTLLNVLAERAGAGIITGIAFSICQSIFRLKQATVSRRTLTCLLLLRLYARL